MDDKGGPSVAEGRQQQGGSLTESGVARGGVGPGDITAMADDENDTLEIQSKHMAQEQQHEAAPKSAAPETEKIPPGKNDEEYDDNLPEDDERKDKNLSAFNNIINSSNNNHNKNNIHEIDHEPPEARNDASDASIHGGSDSDSVSFEAVKREFERNVLQIDDPFKTSPAPEGSASFSASALSSSSKEEMRQQEAPSNNEPSHLRPNRSSFPGRGMAGSGRSLTSGGSRASLSERSPIIGRGRGAPTRIPRSVRTSLTSAGMDSKLHVDIADRRILLRATMSEKFAYKSDDDEDAKNDGDPLPPKRFKKKARSLSMDLGTKVKEQEAARANARMSQGDSSLFQGNRYSVLFGASREQSHYQPKVIRKSRKCDVQTGGETYREVICQRIIDYPQAMNPAERRRKKVVRTGTDDFVRKSMHGELTDPQYRLQSKILASVAFKEQLQSQSVKPGFLTTYLTWSLRARFPIVLLSEALAFWGLICVFATCIYLGAFYQPECLRMPQNTNFEEGGSYFLDAFALSWTTFSTVGYGMLHPQVRREPEETSFHCAFMTALVSLESFVGVLFASFCGAVIVGKLSRAKSAASVRFSERIIIRFGTGVMYTDDDDDRCDDDREIPVSENEKKRSKFPCPVLEFRVANTLFGVAKGEITNSRVSVVGSTLAEKKADTVAMAITSVMGANLNMLKGMKESASHFIRMPFNRANVDSRSDVNGDGLSHIISGAIRQSFTRRSFILPASELDPKYNKDSDQDPIEKKVPVLKRISILGHEAIEKAILKQRIMRRPTRSASMDDMPEGKTEKTKKRKTICVDEDPTGGLVPRKTFSSLKIECDNHPFFKRIWTVRHVLDADSPLLSERVVRMIKECRGFWPAEACEAGFIRENVNFQQLIVSLSGTSGSNGCSVYGIHVYNYRNLHVGYTFTPVLQMTDEKLVADLDRIDNIRIQRGGEAEAIDYYETRLHRDNSASSGRNSETMGQKRAQFLTRSSRSKSIDQPDSADKDSSASDSSDDDLQVRRVSYHNVLRTSTR